jgi:hypothetical protein
MRVNYYIYFIFILFYIKLKMIIQSQFFNFIKNIKKNYKSYFWLSIYAYFSKYNLYFLIMFKRIIAK